MNRVHGVQRPAYGPGIVVVGVSVIELASQAVAGDDDAWRELWDRVEGMLEGYIGTPRYLGRLGQRVADRQNIIHEVMERLRADGMQRLRLFLDLRRDQPDLDFESWLRVLARRVGNDYMRGAPPAAAAESAASTASMRAAAEVVPEPGLSALELWTQGASYPDIARELDLADAEAAEGTVRSALEALRRGHG